MGDTKKRRRVCVAQPGQVRVFFFWAPLPRGAVDVSGNRYPNELLRESLIPTGANREAIFLARHNARGRGESAGCLVAQQ